ncbi:MAG: prolyl oligopeptidase family serine peptidase [Byssovorax sp.]
MPRAPLRIAALTLLAACSPAAPAPIAAPIPTLAAPLPRSTPIANSNPEPAPAPVREIRDVHFGATVVDPYRWMEAPGSRELAAWLQAESAHARRALDALPDRAALLARIQELDHAGSRAWDAEAWGGKYFYLVAEPGKEARCLYVRAGIGGPERLLVDPDPDRGKAEAAIESFTPSIDGRLVAYVTTAGVLHVVETGTGHALVDTLDRVQPGGVAWLPDGRSFFYTRLQKPAAGARIRPTGGRVHVHRLGLAPERDVAVFGAGVTPEIPIDDAAVSFGVAPPGSRYVFAATHRGVTAELDLYLAPRSTLAGKDTPWRKITDAAADSITAFDVRGDDLFLLSRSGAPRGKVLRVSLSHPNLARATTLIAEGTRVIDAIGAARDGLFARAMENGSSQLLRISWKGKGAHPVEVVPLPFEGTVSMLYTQPLADGALFQLDGWTTSPRWFAWDPAAGRTRDTGIVPPSLVDFSAIAVTRATATSADGAAIPLSILHRKDLARDGAHPAWLGVHGAFGVAIEAGFSPERLAWLERGGVFAVCHARGGGEGGEAWHRAATLDHKARTADDLLACAEALVRERFTSPARLGVEAWGAGAIPAMAAITRHPELFGAALLLDGLTNTLRLEAMDGGALASPELGTLATEAGFHALLAMDAYQGVTPTTRYPAMLLGTALADPRSDLAHATLATSLRVEPWQPGKLAARLRAATTSGEPILLRTTDADAPPRAQREAELADFMAFFFAHLGGK